MVEIKQNSIRGSELALVLLVIAVALSFRLISLGQWAFSIDEYYFAKSVVNVLETGLPTFDGGNGYYFRGVIQQYLSAVSVGIFGDLEFSIRLIPVLTNVLTIPYLYLIARKLSNSTAALAAILLFSFSIWELEFARFARMYAPFQLVFVMYAWHLLKATEDPDRYDLKIPLILCVLGLFVHEMGPILLVLNFVPFILNKRNPKLHFYALNVFFLLIAVALHSINFRYALYDGQALPDDYTFGTGSRLGLPLTLPPFLIGTALQSTIGKITSLLSLAMVCTGLYLVATKIQENLFSKLLLSSAVLLAGFNQFALASLALLFGLLTHSFDINNERNRRYYLMFLVLLVTLFIAWFTYGAINSDWLYKVGTLNSERYANKFVQLGGVLFNYPEFIGKLVRPWFRVMPIWFCLLMLVQVVSWYIVIFRAETNEQHYAFNLLIAVTLVCLTFSCVIPSSQSTTRYVFFLYPLLLVAAVVVYARTVQGSSKSDDLAYRSKVLVATAVVFLFMEDYSARHFFSVGSAETNFRTKYSLDVAKHLYPRWDFQSPAEYVNTNISEDQQLVSIEVTPIDLYLESTMDFIYLDPNGIRFYERSLDKGTRDMWTNAVLLSSDQAFEDILSNSSNGTWIVAYAQDWEGKPIPDLRHKYPENLQFTNPQGTIDVFYLPPS